MIGLYKFDSFLKWHYSHSLLFVYAVITISYISLIAIGHISVWWLRLLVFLCWFLVFCGFPFACLSYYLEKIAEVKGLVEKK